MSSLFTKIKSQRKNSEPFIKPIFKAKVCKLKWVGKLDKNLVGLKKILHDPGVNICPYFLDARQGKGFEISSNLGKGFEI